MDFRNLRHFVVVAEELHFGRAAARLSIEQSPLSRSIRDLEMQLRPPLLKRSARGSQLTPAGTALLPEARAILAHAARLKTKVSDAYSAASSCLRVGVCDAVATSRLAVCLDSLRKRYPDLLVEIVTVSPAGSAAALEADAIDVSITLNSPASTKITRTHCWTERFVVVSPKRSASPTKGTLPIAALFDAPEILVVDAWAITAEQWLQALAAEASGRRVPPLSSMASPLVFLATIGVSRGLALLPSGLGRDTGLGSVSTQSIAGRTPRLSVELLYREGNPHPGIEAFRAVLSAHPWRGPATALSGAPAETPDHWR